jgi:hypothetical protein
LNSNLLFKPLKPANRGGLPGGNLVELLSKQFKYSLDLAKIVPNIVRIKRMQAALHDRLPEVFRRFHPANQVFVVLQLVVTWLCSLCHTRSLTSSQYDRARLHRPPTPSRPSTTRYRLPAKADDIVAKKVNLLQAAFPKLLTPLEPSGQEKPQVSFSGPW